MTKAVQLESCANLLMQALYAWPACSQRMLLHSKATASSAQGSEHGAAVSCVEGKFKGLR